MVYRKVENLNQLLMAGMAAETPVNRNIYGLGELIAGKKEEVRKQFDMLRANLNRKEHNLCAMLDEVMLTAFNSHKCFLRSIEQLEVGRASLEATLKENHVLNMLEKTVVDLNNEKERLLEQDDKIPKNLQIVWNLEPFIRDLENLCSYQLSCKSDFEKKVVNLRRIAGQSFGFVIMSDASNQTSICRITEGSPAHVGGLRIGDILLEMNGQDLSNVTHADIVERIQNLVHMSLSIQRIYR